MKTTILTICLVACTAFAAQAQEAKGTGENPTITVDRHACIMANEETLLSFGLNADELSQVKAIQEACKQGRNASKNEQEAMASLEVQEAAFKAALTDDQYTKYTAWCIDNYGEKK